MSDKIVALASRRKSRVRPLSATYDPKRPYVVEREDHDDGYISYRVVDMRANSYREVCAISDRDNMTFAKRDAEEIVRALNMLVAYDLEGKLPEEKEDGD